ncbi:hypothetical protein BGZ60DRAFT_126893 [Tricladium varicosporioides]|nr:hypothetical protein BGZ60DRAFT_126893 [Hymenoscyphus varicosporioides]
MAANFQPQMGGPGQMMPQQQQRPQQQRPPQGGGQNATTQIQQVIFQTVTNQTGPLTGWQANVLIQERISLIFNIIGNLRLASQNQPNSPGLNKMIEIGIKFEKEIFDKSPDKPTYKRQVEDKLQQLLERRSQNQAGLQQTIQQQAQAQAQAQQQQVQQQMMMNQNGMQGQPPRTMGQQPTQQGFQHLQHQMQASPLPGQQPQQMGMGMGNDNLPPNMAQNQQQFQMPMQQPQQPQQPNHQPGGPQPPLTQQDQAILMELATRLMAQAPNEEKTAIRASLRQRMNPQQLQQYQVQGQDPLILYYRNQALSRLRADRQQRMAQAQAQQQIAMGQQPGNMPNAAPPMQQQRSVQPSPMNAPSQPPTSMGGNADFGGFAGNMEMQQQQGVLAQESGQVVVPASGAQRNSTPQPGMMGLPMGMNDQRAMANPNNRAQQQQVMLNAQQMQQQRAQATQQSQAQARMNAQAKAQMGLTGQPGGMGNGPMPPQQSPLPTLNAPLRTPSQMGHPEPSQMNPSPQFGQPLDPRFAQGNQRQFGQGNGMNVTGLNPAMFAGMNQDQIRSMNGLPAEKLNEMMAKWNQNKMVMQAQAGRPGMPMQGGGQLHPGQQIPQPGQFNPQNPGMNGQAQAQNMASAMSPQQQALLQQQINRLRQNPSMQQQANMNPGAVPPEQRMQMQMQMDMMDFPPTLHNHANMPRGVPPEIKKWGQLKQWAQQNPSLGPEVSEHLKGLQKLHWQQLIRQRGGQPASQQPGGMPIGMQGGPGNMPMIPAGNAPVAPMMGPNGMQMPGGMPVGPGQVRQPTLQDIQMARQHPSGKMANATDDQIRAFLVRQMMMQKQREQLQQQQQQQQQQNQLMQNLQMSTQLNQMPGQPRPGQPQPNPNARMQNQVPPQVPQSKQQPPGPGPGVSGNNAANANRPRPTPNNARNTGPNSSPAQPPNKLKRASSDDPIEVPNPNAPQNRPQPQQAQDFKGQGQPGQMQKQPSSQGRPTLTPQQVANLDPEARKKYEMNARMAQVARGPMDQATKADLEKLRSIAQEEASKTQPVDDVPMDQGMKDTVTRMLREIKQPLTNMTKAIPRWYQITHDENRAREFFRLNTRLKKQFVDNNLTQPKETFSITVKEIEHARVILNGMVKDLSDRFPKMKKSDSNQPPAPSTSQSAAAPGVLTAANLKEQQQQLDKMHQRSNSRNSQAPPAPTSPQAPFQFGSAKSPPDGVPAYANQNRLTQSSLILPPKKKQKHGGVSTPGGQGTPGSTASPQVSKAVSPEIKRHPAEMRAQPKRLLCNDSECERHNIGFENEEALRIHTQEEHTIDNPLQFAQQNLASLLGVDVQGQSIKPPAENPGPVAPQMSTSGSKQGQTPNIKAGGTPVATPMNRQVSMNRQGSATGARPATPSKTATAKDGTTKPALGQGNTTVPQMSQPQQEISTDDPWANATIDPHDLFQAFKTFESGAGGAISDINVYRSITPNDTPESSKDGVSEPNSDISEGVALDVQLDIFDDNWMPFGPSEVGTSFDISNFDIPKEEDIGMSMFDEEQPAINFQWDDMLDQAAFDKPFNFDTSLYSMSAD